MPATNPNCSNIFVINPFLSALVCDLLPRRLFHGMPTAHCQKSISVTLFKSTAWRSVHVGVFGGFPARARGGEGALAPRATWSRPNSGDISISQKKMKNSSWATQVWCPLLMNLVPFAGKSL